MPSIKILTGANSGESYPLVERQTVLGRRPDCTIVLNDSTVSRLHARITRDGDHYFVDDVGSQHGTRVNGDLVRVPHRLYDQDEIQLSVVKLLFVDDSVNGLRTTDGERSSTIITSLDVLGDSSVSDDSQAAPRWRALLDITRSLGVSLDLKEILPNVLENTFRILPKATRGCIMLVDPAGGRLRPYAMKDLAGVTSGPPPISRTISRAVMTECRAVLLNDEDENFEASESVLELKMRSVLCAPLVGTSDQPYGLIHLDSQEPTKQFNSDDLEILVNIANLVGQAVDHAHLHETQLQFDRRERDLETARQVQRHFLPQDRPEVPGYQIADYYKPADAVGGDYFGYTRLPDGQLALAVGDVAGHGVPAALLMARLCSEARYCLVTDIIPSDAVESLNQQLTKQTYSFFITFALCVLDAVRHELTVVNAGHMPPLIRRASTGEVEEIGAQQSSPPLGIDPSLEYSQVTIKLEPGDMVAMYTDGISECPSPSGARYGIDRIHMIARSTGNARELIHRLLSDVRRFNEGLPQEDDTCVVAFSRDAE